MEKWFEFIQNHAAHAHWFVFGATLLAGFNLPVSIDILMLISATLAAAFLPAHLFHLFFAMFFGCLFSAWISYWFGRKIIPLFLHRPFFSKIFNSNRMQRVKTFHEKKGFWGLLLGRFIPFGVRNCLFMSCGMSRLSFLKFLLWDGVACLFWSSTCFFLYYTLGKNREVLYHHIKMINLLIFIVFSVTVIGLFWYKNKKNLKGGNV